MNLDQTNTCQPLLCDGPDTDTSVAAMVNLQSAHEAEPGRLPPLSATPEQWQTIQGTRVSFIAALDRPMFDITLRFRAGNVLDGATPGLAALTLYSLDQGTEQLDAAQFAEEIAASGAILSKKISDDSAVITLRCLSVPALRASVMERVTDMLARPGFRGADVDKIRQRLAFNRARQVRHPLIRISQATIAHVFSGHPYADSTQAQLDNSIGEEQVRAFHKQAYSANNLDIGLVGNLTREEAEQLVNRLVSALPQHWAAAAPPPLPVHQPLVQHLEASGSAVHSMLTVASSVSPRDPIFPALTLLNALLGGSHESRLSQELRNLRGLTYAVYSELKPLDAASVLQIHWDTAPQYGEAAARLVSAMLTCLHERGPSQAECDLAVSQIAGKLHHDLADNAKLANALATFRHQGLPGDYLSTYLDKLQALTPANLREAAQIWLSNAAQVLVTLGPLTEQLPLPEPTPVDQ